MSGYASKLAALAWDRASHWLATADREIVTLWDFAQGATHGANALDLDGPLDIVRDLAFHPSQPWLAAGDRSGGLLVWSLSDRKYRLVWHGALRGGFQRQPGILRTATGGGWRGRHSRRLRVRPMKRPSSYSLLAAEPSKGCWWRSS